MLSCVKQESSLSPLWVPPPLRARKSEKSSSTTSEPYAKLLKRGLRIRHYTEDGAEKNQEQSFHSARNQ